MKLRQSTSNFEKVLMQSYWIYRFQDVEENLKKLDFEHAYLHSINFNIVSSFVSHAQIKIHLPLCFKIFEVRDEKFES